MLPLNSKMGGNCLKSVVDALLFTCFLYVTFTAPLGHSEDWLPLSEDQTPAFMVNFRKWYASRSGNYLLWERPRFFIGLVRVELLVLWPLSVANLYAILASKSWFNTTCLIAGVTVFTGMAACVPELAGSGKASDKLLIMYYFFWGFGALATLRGLPWSTPTAYSTTKTKKT